MNSGKNTLGLAGFVASILAMLLFGKTTSVGQDCTGDVCSDCPDNSTGKINIMDLGTGFYGGLQGGLYPNGENSRPINHNDAGLALTDAVVPLDMNGEEDFVNGKVVLLSIGFSNAQAEYCYFKDKADALPQRNPYLVVVNGAIAGWPIEKIIDPTINQVYWEGDDNAIPPIKGVEDFLEDADANWGQVQAIWFKTANLGPTETDFRDYILTLRNQYIDGMAILQEKFPNNRLCYLSDRTFGGYSLDLGNPEPYAYWTGWAVKRLIQGQLDGNLPYGEDSPWLSWGPYLWADGVIERSDGLKWQCDDFRVNDRRHPSDCGKDQVSDMLIDFFSTDETTRPWFLRTKLINSGGGLFVTTDRDRFGPDGNYVGGTLASTEDVIVGTEDPGLYQDYREGSTTLNGRIEYNVPVPNSGSGDYRITLHFVEPLTIGMGQRVFDIKCEGMVIEDNFDIVRDAGDDHTAYSLWFDTDVSDASLTLKFIPQRSRYKPLICAIEIDYRTATESVSSVDIVSEIPETTPLLNQNYPNPFNPSTTIRYSVPKMSDVTLKVFDLLGNEIETLVSERKEEGTYSVEWEAKGHPSGVYFYRLEAGEYRETRKLIVLK